MHVVRHGTIQAASKEEGVPKSTVSRRITRLEEDLGVELLRRSSHAVKVTSEGRALYERVHRAFEAIRDAEAFMRDGRDEPSGRLVVTAPHDLGRSAQIARLLSAYKRLYPAVDIEVMLAERMVDLVQEGVDVALRAYRGALPGDGELKAKRLMRGEMGLYASTSYMAKRGEPSSLNELTSARGEHVFIAHAIMRDGVTMQRDNGAKETLEVVFPSSWCVNSFSLLSELIIEGEGIGLVPLFLGAEVAQKSVQRLLPAWSMRSTGLSVVWSATRDRAPRVRAFVELTEAFFQREFAP